MRRTTLALSCLTAILAACGDGPTDPPAGGGVALVITPGALLLSEPGSTARLQAVAVDADGDSTLVDAAFQTSDAAIVSIGADDVAIAGASLGSAQIVATSGELTSAPILVLRATPAAGAILVADSQLMGAIVPVDANAPYGPGWEYRVRLRGVSPTVGQVMLGSGGAAIGGRVASVARSGSDVEVVLQLLALNEMFESLSVSQQMSLEHATLAVPEALRSELRPSRTSGGALRLDAPRGAARLEASVGRPSRSSGSLIEQEFDLGSFTCKAEVPQLLTFPLSLDVFSIELDPSLALDLVIEDATLQRFVIEGGIAPRISASPRITAALEAKAECKIHAATLILPIGGPLSLIIAGQVPLGLGFEAGAKASFGNLGFDAFLEGSIDAAFGIDCAAGCAVVAEVEQEDPGGFFKPVVPNLGTDVRFELGASVFGWGELRIGNRFIEALQFKTVELKAGLEQKFELASPEMQAADPAYASSYSLKPVLEAKAGASLAPLEDLLRISIASLSFAPNLPTLAQSPSGTFTITPSSVASGGETQVGELATFTVTLPAATYLGAYAIEGVEIRWRRSVGETIVLEPGRPGCTDIAAAQDQLSFTCQTDFLAEHVGTQTFHAFVRTRIFGVPVPVPLEIAADGRATVNVTDAASLSISPSAVTLARGATQQFTVSVGGTGSQDVTWQVTGGTYVTAGNVLTYTAGNTPGTYSVTATSVADPSRSAVATVEIVEPTGTGEFAILAVLPVSAGVSVGQCSQGQLLQGLGTSLLAYQSPTWQCTANEPPTTIARANVGFSISGLTGASVTISANGSVHLDQSAADEWVASGATNEGFRFRVTGGTIPFRLSGTLTAAADGYAQAYITGIELTRRATAESGPINVDDSGLLPPGDYSLLLQAGSVNTNLDADGGFNLTLRLGQ